MVMTFTYGKFNGVLQLVVILQLLLLILNVGRQLSELVNFHQLARHHRLARRLPFVDSSLVARQLWPDAAAKSSVEAATDRRVQTRPLTSSVRRHAVRMTHLPALHGRRRVLEALGTVEERWVDDLF